AYDVVLIDIRLSDANGYECFRRLREINTAVPIIMMTSRLGCENFPHGVI
ncbi:hypothetical protein E3A20_18780, partial [Planctomyces bekefii]